MVAQHGGEDGPSCWKWIGENLLDGKDEQASLSWLLSNMRYDGSRTVLSFFSEFHTISGAILPAIPQARLCTMYASMFPAREYISIIAACDITPGHDNFMAFANAVNAGIQRWHQRILNERRDGYGHGHDQLYTTYNTTEEDEFEAYMTDSTTFHNKGDAPGYEVIELARPAVAMRSDFRKALWSPSVAYKESGIESYFNGSPHLKLPDGKKVPVLEVDHIYALPRWTSRAQAEHSRGIFLQDKVLYACLRAHGDPPALPWAAYLDQPVEVGGASCKHERRRQPTIRTTSVPA